MARTTYNKLLALQTKPSQADVFLKKVNSLKEGGIKRLTTSPLSQSEAKKEMLTYRNRLSKNKLTVKYGIMLDYTEKKKAHIWLIHWNEFDIEKVEKSKDRYREKNQDEKDNESETWRQLTPEQYNTTIEQLDLSSRTLNCLKRASLDTVGQILETERADLLKIRNFGVKSFNELNDKFRTMGFLPEGFSWINEEEPAEPAEPIKPCKPVFEIRSRSSRYAEEHNAPAMALIEEFTLPNKTTVPKVPQMTVDDVISADSSSETTAFEYDETPVNIPRASAEEVEAKRKEVVAAIEKDLNVKIPEETKYIMKKTFISKLKNKFK